MCLRVRDDPIRDYFRVLVLGSYRDQTNLRKSHGPLGKSYPGYLV